MSEEEELKANAARAKSVQTVKEVSTYLDNLSATIDLASRRHRDSSIIYGVAWIAWVAGGFFTDMDGRYLLVMIFMFAMIYDQYRFQQLRRAYGEFFGAIKILQILGMIPPDREDGETKKREYVSEFFDMVKGWATKKKEAQEKVFQPA